MVYHARETPPLKNRKNSVQVKFRRSFACRTALPVGLLIFEENHLFFILKMRFFPFITFLLSGEDHGKGTYLPLTHNNVPNTKSDIAYFSVAAACLQEVSWTRLGNTIARMKNRTSTMRVSKINQLEAFI